MIDSIENKISREVSEIELITDLEHFILEYENLINARLHINILSDLYLNNIYYQNENQKLDEFYLIIENKYREILKTLLKYE